MTNLRKPENGVSLFVIPQRSGGICCYFLKDPLMHSAHPRFCAMKLHKEGVLGGQLRHGGLVYADGQILAEAWDEEVEDR